MLRACTKYGYFSDACHSYVHCIRVAVARVLTCTIFLRTLEGIPLSSSIPLGTDQWCVEFQHQHSRLLGDGEDHTNLKVHVARTAIAVLPSLSTRYKLLTSVATSTECWEEKHRCSIGWPGKVWPFLPTIVKVINACLFIHRPPFELYNSYSLHQLDIIWHIFSALWQSCSNDRYSGSHMILSSGNLKEPCVLHKTTIWVTCVNHVYCMHEPRASHVWATRLSCVLHKRTTTHLGCARYSILILYTVQYLYI